jgi:hypothetical protein
MPFEVLTAANIKITFPVDVVYLEDGRSRPFRNVETYLINYKES